MAYFLDVLGLFAVFGRPDFLPVLGLMASSAPLAV